VTKELLKSASPSNKPIKGEMILVLIVVTIDVKAAPRMTPIAIDKALPLLINVLNSENNFFMFVPPIN
jgi:hypothetical protein